MGPRAIRGVADSLDSLRRSLRRLPAFIWITDAELNLTRIEGSIREPLRSAIQEKIAGERFEPLLQGRKAVIELEINGRWYYLAAEPLLDASGQVLGSVGVGIDLSERRRFEERLEAENAMLNEAQHLAALGSWVLHLPGRKVILSPTLRAMLGITSADRALPFSQILRRIHPAEQHKAAIERPKFIADGGTFQTDHRMVRDDGEVRYIRWRGRIENDEFGKPLRCIGTAQDVTDIMRAQIDAERRAYHDALTGLPNRVLLRDRLTQTIASARRSSQRCYVAFIDLDNFKQVNDTLGHAEGDMLLAQVARRLSETVRETDTVARPGGDEFVLVLPDVTEENSETALEKIRSAFARPFTLADGDHVITASIGVAVYPDDGRSEDELLEHADAAMYEAKHEGRNRIRRFRHEYGTLKSRRVQMQRDVRDALHESQLAVYYQPVIDPRTQEPAGVEALLRWNHPRLGLLYPDRFFELAEDSALAVEVGDWVLAQTLRQTREWQRRGAMLLRAGVNVSAAQLIRSARLAKRIARALDIAQIDPSRLEIEIPEAALLDDIRTSAALVAEIRALGVGVAIDHFGSNSNHLTYLKHFDVSALKIDRSLAASVESDAVDRAIAGGLVSIGKTLGVRVVAEGVETAAQLQSMMAMGCDEIQGHFFSPALPAEKFAENYLPLTSLRIG
jgi:diguanylate cyclase (GGDEF)-like protein